MNEISAEETKLIETYVVPKIVKSLGKEDKVVRCKISFPENCFFLSYVCFVDLIFGEPNDKNEEKSENTLKLVIKKLPRDDFIVDLMGLMKQFHNEILFYTKFARGNSRFPRYVYANEDMPDNTVIVIENISVQGYELCPEVYDLPFEYVFSAMSEIGRLHAIAYVMKEREPERFHNIVGDIREPRFREDGWFGDYVNVIASRPIDLLRRHNYDANFCDRIERHLDNAYSEIMLTAAKPVEPLATLCHGDFTRNNIFFRKNDDKLEAKLFDFALIRYSSPAIDLSTFLYLNCSAEHRVERFDELYHSYHGTLIKHLCDSGIEDLEKYSYEKMLADYKRRAAFGYIIAIFFLPIVRNIFSVDMNSLRDDLHRCALEVRKAGGDAMTEVFAKMVLELRDMGSFDHVR